MSSIQFAWIVMQVLQAGLFSLLLFRPGRKTYSAFTAYIGFCVARSTVLLVLDTAKLDRAYFLVYWVGAAMGTLLILAILYSIFSELFLPARILPSQIRSEMLLGLGAVVILAILVGALLSNNSHSAVEVIQTIDRGLDALKFSFCGFILIFAHNLKLPWRRRLYGLTAGLFFDTAARLAYSVLNSAPLDAHFLAIYISVSHCLAMAIWVTYFAAPEPSLVTLSPQQSFRISRLIDQLEETLHKPRGDTNDVRSSN